MNNKMMSSGGNSVLSQPQVNRVHRSLFPKVGARANSEPALSAVPPLSIKDTFEGMGEPARRVRFSTIKVISDDTNNPNRDTLLGYVDQFNCKQKQFRHSHPQKMERTLVGQLLQDRLLNTHQEYGDPFYIVNRLIEDSIAAICEEALKSFLSEPRMGSADVYKNSAHLSKQIAYAAALIVESYCNSQPFEQSELTEKVYKQKMTCDIERLVDDMLNQLVEREMNVEPDHEAHHQLTLNREREIGCHLFFMQFIENLKQEVGSLAEKISTAYIEYGPCSGRHIVRLLAFKDL